MFSSPQDRHWTSSEEATLYSSEGGLLKLFVFIEIFGLQVIREVEQTECLSNQA